MNEKPDESNDQGADRAQAAEQAGARLSEAELRNILEGHQAWLDGKEAGERANLSGVNLGGADLRKANLHSANLSAANLDGADLTDADLRNADLSGAELTGVTGLLGNQLGGSNVSGARLPDDIAAFDALNHVTELSQTARNTFLALVGACVFCWITIGSTTDVELVTNSASSSLPILDAEVPIVWFFVAAPLALFSLEVYLHLFLQPFWHGLARLPAIFPDGRTLDQRAYPWLLSGLVRAHVRLLQSSRPPLSRLQNFVSIVFAWWIVPLTLFLFWLRYLPKHDWYGTTFHIVILVVSVGFGSLTYWSARELLRGDKVIPFRLTEWWSRQRISRIIPFFLVGIVFWTFSNEAINGNRAVKCQFLGDWTLVPTAFKCLGYDVFANLDQEIISVRPADWRKKDDPQLELVRKRELRGVNLRFASAIGAFFVKANLVDANLEDADFSGADLREAFLWNAELQRVNLTFADLRKAKFPNADLRNAKLRNADLQGAELRNADLSGAILAKARNLSQEQLDRACGDEKTELPPGLTIPLCPQKSK